MNEEYTEGLNILWYKVVMCGLYYGRTTRKKEEGSKGIRNSCN